MTKSKWQLWAGRGLIGIVLLFNVQCALAFLISPELYTSGFELSGPPGEGVVRGFGILFLMWNVPYCAAALHPLRFRTSLREAVVMQAIGLIGETLLLITFPPGHPVVAETVRRFVYFDGFGLMALLLAVWVTYGLTGRTAR